MRRFFQILARLVGGLVLLGIPALLIYLQFVGFGEGWRAEVARALGGSGYRVVIGSLTFHPFRGIVAGGVDLFRRDATGRQLARIDRVEVSPNLAKLLRGQVSIDRLGLKNASVTIPFAEDGLQPDSVELRGISADILNGNGQLTISHAEFWFRDLHVTIRGHFLNPEQANSRSEPGTPGDIARRAQGIRSVLRVLDRVHFTGAKPTLLVVVHGDLLHPESIAADEIALNVGGVRFDELTFDRVSVAATFDDGTARLSKLHATGSDGNIQTAGEWSFAQGAGHFHVNGNLNWAPLLVLAGRKDLAKEIVFEQPPDLEASITAERGEKGPMFSAIGHVATKGFRVRGMTAKSFSAAAAWKEGRLFVQDAVLQSGTGTVRADVLMGPGLFKLKLASDAVPNEFMGFFGPNERRIIELLKFEAQPKLNVTLAGTRANLDALSGTGTIELGRTAMRDSWVDFAKADLVIKDRAIVYNDLTIGKGRLRATGSFTYDFGRQEVRLDGVRSNIDPPDVLMWVDPRVAKTVAVYRFRTPPDVRADGVAHMKDPTRNDLRIEVDAPGGLTYSLLNKDLVFGDVGATVLLKGQRVLADVSRATLYGGDVAVNAKVSTDPGNPTFSADVTAESVDFPSLTKLYFGYAKSEGAMSGKYSFDADLKNPSAMQGRGSIRVENGHVMSIPLFGPLSVIMGTIIPGAGHEGARLATMDFTIGEQHIRTKNLDIQGSGFELFGDGSVAFPSGRLDLTVRINAKGIPGIVLFPVSKLFEYVSVGTMSDPQWRPKIIPREFFDVLGLGGGDAEAGDGTAGPKEPARKSAPKPRSIR
jgi:AsmA-like C-terminal region